MGKYLDPRFDLTFKNVFGRHKDLVTSFLNALIPFKKRRGNKGGGVSSAGDAS